MKWRQQAACKGADQDIFFHTQVHANARAKTPWKAAREYCDPCPVKLQCLDHAMNYVTPAVDEECGGIETVGERFGYFAGTSATERTKMRRMLNGYKAAQDRERPDGPETGHSAGVS